MPLVAPAEYPVRHHSAFASAWWYAMTGAALAAAGVWFRRWWRRPWV